MKKFFKLLPLVGIISSLLPTSSFAQIPPIETDAQLVVISPHQDDALLTFAGFLSRAKHENRRIEINVMFGLSNYSTNWNDVLTQSQVSGISKRRFAEDFDGLSELLDGWKGFHYKIQGLWDAPLRLYSGETTAGGGSAGTFADFRPEEIEAFEFAVESIKPILQRDNTEVLVPIANGSHIDHFIAREAVITAAYQLGDRVKASIFFGQDQPYTGANPENENVEIDALKARLPEGSISEIYDSIPTVITDDGSTETVKLYLYKKYYLTQYDEGYIEPLTSNTMETSYRWDSGYEKVTTHPDCNGDYCLLNPSK